MTKRKQAKHIEPCERYNVCSWCCCWVLADSHHEQYEGQHQSGVRSRAEHFTKPGGEVGLQRLSDDIKHTFFPTEERRMIVTELKSSHCQTHIPRRSSITWRVHSQRKEEWWRWCKWRAEWTGRGWPATWPCKSCWIRRPWRLFPVARYSTSPPSTAGTWTHGAGGRSGQGDRGHRTHPSWRPGKRGSGGEAQSAAFHHSIISHWLRHRNEICFIFLPYHSLIEDQAQDVPTDIKLRVGRLSWTTSKRQK